MAEVRDQELVDRFETFYRRYYADEIAELARGYPRERKSLEIDWEDLFRFDPDFADDVVSYPDRFRDAAEEALRLYDLPVDVSLAQAHVRIQNLGEVTEIREIRSDHINTLVSVRGIVRKATNVRPKIQEATFVCQRCGAETIVPQTDAGFQDPYQCESCERQGPFQLDAEDSEFVDAQKLRVQESPEGLGGGETPQAVDMNVEDDLTGEVTPGDHVVATGILRLDQGKENSDSPIFDVYLEGVSLDVEDEEFEEMDITEADKREIIELSETEDLYEQIVDSLAPAIYGYEQAKLAMALQLFSGVTKHLPDGSRIRGDLHMLLIGDPGTGKCVAGNTNVTLADGTRRPIRDIVEAELDDPKPVDDGVYQEVDIPLPTMDATGDLRIGRATKVWKREAPDQLYRIHLADGTSLEVTPSHPLFVRRNGGPEAAKAENLSEGIVVATANPVAVDGGSMVADPVQENDNGQLRRTASKRSREVAGLPTSVGWTKIDDIETVAPENEWVYDLEVEGTHNYLTEHVVSHNSQLLQYIRNIAPRSVYTSGKGSSSAGLTAAAVRDDFGDGQQWTLEAGALVLADQGIAAVDELDKMRPEDRSAMHEALEQQSYHPNSEILLADGRRVEIGSLVDERMAASPNEVVDGVDCEILPVDDVRVHSVDMETNDVSKVPVDRVSRHDAPDQFVRVTFSNGRSVLVTPEHPMFVAGEEGVGTVEARSLGTGAFVPAPRKLPNSSVPISLDGEPHIGKEKDIDLPHEMSDDLAEILGFLVAEGHSYAGSSHEIGFSNQDERLLARMDSLFHTVFGMESTNTTNSAGTVTQRWVSTKLYRWFEQNFPKLMEKARKKRIPDAILGGSEEEIRRFLVGAFAGDGGVESEAMAFSTASPDLAEDYADALAKIGVASRIHYSKTEDSWKTYVMGDSTERFVEHVVEPTDDRFEKARAFVDRSLETKRHHDVLPTSAARELRSLKRLLGVSLTGKFRPHLDNDYGVRIETIEAELDALWSRATEVRDTLEDTTTLSEVRSVIGWSGRALADRLDGVTTSAIHYAEEGGYDVDHRNRLIARAKSAIRDALSEFESRAAVLQAKTDLRYYRVTDVETVPNEGEYETDWVYDVTVEPTNTFVSQGVVLHNSISISKAGINATLKARCSLLGAANPKYGRFDQYESIGEQIDLEPALISRFDLIFTITDQPDAERDAELANHILQTNYAGELNTHRSNVTTSNVSDEEVEGATEEVEPAIDAELLRKYVAYSRRTTFPTMTPEARSTIEDFYVDLRSKGQDEDAPVPVTARKLEALVRLAEASARVRLSDTVEKADAERVIEIVRTSLQAVGVDPETDQYDADVIETGTSKSQRDRIKNIKHLIEDIESEFDEGAPVDEVLARAEEVGMERSKAEHEIEKLKQRGEVYEPSTDHLRTT
ncbi:DNA endonuclease related to intein-encoded endonuclease [Halanaeroarchaeum sp. HSR-CO]|uniref:LAGLIDADG family homing endonuclease n=1 Tax=Halanaeroarchaeum sp. HSR-CO TaxID=2866382 RepID=UPI00217CE317|nr:LAGLIDADG family homing endonuclease [Halanaeroarchaeum sp. HSR-CO]UWG46492.1 DNA endonuclease related to intein-encoded endonuclease [Halanaeroarchaeum sp. HSR-CO]